MPASAKVGVSGSSFERVTDDALETHLGVVRYGEFVLTDAVRPSYDLQVVPTQGFRHDVYNDAENKASVPVLMAAAMKLAVESGRMAYLAGRMEKRTTASASSPQTGLVAV